MANMHMSRRLLLKGAVAQAATLGLLACGSSSTPAAGSSSGSSATKAATSASGGTSASPAASAATKAATSSSASSGKKTHIVYWGSFSGANGDAEQAVVQKFNDSQSDVEVEYQFQGTYEETAQKLTAALAAKQGPDVCLLSDVWWFKFYLNRAIAPLDSYLKSNNIDTSDYVESFFAEGVRKGQHYWMPFARSTPIFYYNKQYWQEAGLPDRGPDTWDEFVSWAPKLKKDNRAAYAHVNGASYSAWVFEGTIWQFGGQYSTPDFNITLNDAKGVDAGNFWKQSVVDGWASTPQDVVVDFSNGLAAAFIGSTGSIGSVQKSAQFKFGTAFLPKKEQFGCPTGGAGMCLMSGSSKEKQDAAFKFMAFASSPDTTAYWAQKTGYLPVRKSAQQNPDMQKFLQDNPNFKTAVDQLPKTRGQDAARVFIPNGDQTIGKGLDAITIDKQDVTKAFTDVANQLKSDAKPVLDQIKAIEG